MEIEPFSEVRAREESKAQAERIWRAEVENAFYRTFKTPDGKIVIDFLCEQLEVKHTDVTLATRKDPVVNAQRDAMKMVYWLIRELAEAGAKRKGDRLEAV